MKQVRRITLVAVPCALFVAIPMLCDANDWPQFRGPNSSGVAEGPAPPAEFGPGKNELWQLPLGSGHSSPCVVGDRIFLTSFEEETKQLELICVDRQTGEIQWRKGVTVEELETGHPSFNPASCTPASDGECVIAYFGSYGLICFSIEGEKRWEIRMPLSKSYAGNATSPIIAGDRVILHRGNYVDHFLLSVDKETGDELWRFEQSEKFTPDMACTATPIVYEDKVLVHAARAVQAFELESGDLVWQANCSTTATSTPVLANGKLIVATWNQTGEASQTPVLPSFEKLVEDNDESGNSRIERGEFPRFMLFHRSEGTEAPQNGAPLRFEYVDTNRDRAIDESEWLEWLKKNDARRATYVPHGLIAIDVESQGALNDDQIDRLENDGIPEVPSPLYHNGLIYFIKNGGILTCVDLERGERVYRVRTGGRGTHYASPVIAGELMFTASGDGIVTVMSLGENPEVLATNDLKSGVFATPAIVDGVLYVRTHDALHAFGRAE